MKNKGKFYTFFYSKQFIFVCVILVCFMVFVLTQEHNRQKKINNKIAELNFEVKNLESSNFELAHLLVYLKSNESMELEARKTLGYKKPGEKVIVIEGSGNAEALGAQNNQENSNLQKWFRYFFNNKEKS